MRLLNEDEDKGINRILLLLTKSEAMELRDAIDLLLNDAGDRHEHVSSEDYKKEVTIADYDEAKLNNFNERARRLIITDG
jgi:hypothetical protein